MTPLEAAQRLDRRIKHVPSEPPEAWSVLMRRVGIEAVRALERNNPFQVRDQALLQLVYTLSRAGRHASWRIAQAQPVGIVQVHWLACGRWHHEVYTTLHAGWERRAVLGSNRPLPLEANQIPNSTIFCRPMIVLF